MKGNRAPRIAFFLPTPGALTGAPRRVLTLMIGLQNTGEFDVALICDPSEPLVQEATRAGIRILEVRTGQLLSARHGALLSGSATFRGRVAWELLKYNLRLLRVLRGYGADVLWIRGSKGIAFAGLAGMMRRCPIVWDIDQEPPAKGIVACLHELGLWLSRRVVLQYAGAKERIFGMDRLGRFHGKIRSLIPGIDFARLQRAKEYRSRKNWGESSSGPFRILQVGTICDRKNQRFTLRVMYELRRAWPHLDVELWIAGSEYEPDYVDALQRDLSRYDLGQTVRLLGWRDDIPELMAKANMLVLPSKDEGVPNVVQEAMYIGCPVLASDVGGIPEIIENERTGWILPIDDASRWAEKIALLIRKREILVEAALQASSYAERTFSMDAWVHDYSAVFREVIDGLVRT